MRLVVEKGGDPPWLIESPGDYGITLQDQSGASRSRITNCLMDV